MAQNPEGQSVPTSSEDKDITASTPSVPPNAVNQKRPKKLLISGLLLAIPLIVLGALVAKEYLRAKKYTSDVSKVQSSDYYKEYVKNIHTYLENNGGEYVNYRTCNVTTTDSLWNFKQPEDSKYYYSSFSMVYNELEGKLRGEQQDIKKNMPGEYKKNAFSGIASKLDDSIQKRQQVLDLTSSLDVLFNSNEHIDYCQRLIYSDTIDRLTRIKVNADGTNTVVSGSDTDFSKKQADELIKTLGSQKVPAGFVQVHQEFVDTLKSIAATYSEVSKGNNTSESVKKYREVFQGHKSSLDKNLKDLAEAAKTKITAQPHILSEQLKAVEE
jgi:hypothetical protein